ncbi:MAG TPA: helix-turn-helix transcriptional regulator [Solirubrobacteraceae bacterium]
MRERPDLDLARTLRRLREERSLTQEQLAFEAGITSSGLSRIERGLNDPGWTTVRRLAGALGIGLGELVASLADERHRN